MFKASSKDAPPPASVSAVTAPSSLLWVFKIDMNFFFIDFCLKPFKYALAYMYASMPLSLSLSLNPVDVCVCMLFSVVIVLAKIVIELAKRACCSVFYHPGMFCHIQNWSTVCTFVTCHVLSPHGDKMCRKVQLLQICHSFASTTIICLSFPWCVCTCIMYVFVCWVLLSLH